MVLGCLSGRESFGVVLQDRPTTDLFLVPSCLWLDSCWEDFRVELARFFLAARWALRLGQRIPWKKPECMSHVSALNASLLDPLLLFLHQVTVKRGLESSL